MKRIATAVAVVTAAVVAAPVAGAGNDLARSKPRVTAQVVGVQVARVQRATVAISLQRHLVQVANANRLAIKRVGAR